MSCTFWCPARRQDIERRRRAEALGAGAQYQLRSCLSVRRTLMKRSYFSAFGRETIFYAGLNRVECGVSQHRPISLSDIVTNR